MPLLLPYKAGSQSAKLLAQGLGISRVKLRNENVGRFRANPTIVNWGNSTYPEIPGANYLNKPSAIATASNKLKAFQAMSRATGRDAVNLPTFTTDIRSAKRWQEGGGIVVERHKLTGHSADGLVLKKMDEELSPAPLYVGYLSKKEEYRVHVMNGVAFHVQRKARKMDVPDDAVNWQVRNLANGFIYQINLDNHKVPDDVLEQARRAVRALGLDFGAVDIIWHPRNGTHVLEVNTACGIEGTTLDKYIGAIQAVLNGRAAQPFVQEAQPRPEVEEVVRNNEQPAPAAPAVPQVEPQRAQRQMVQNGDIRYERWTPARMVLNLDNVRSSMVNAGALLNQLPDELIRDNIELFNNLAVQINTRLINVMNIRGQDNE